MINCSEEVALHVDLSVVQVYISHSVSIDTIIIRTIFIKKFIHYGTNASTKQGC